MELSRLSQGEVIGLDVNQPHLDEFAKKIKQAGLSDRVKVVNCSMLEMDLPDRRSVGISYGYLTGPFSTTT